MYNSEAYECFDQFNSQELIYTQSTLYNIEPRGIGSPLLESLTSYLARLSVEHSVLTGKLIDNLMGPLFKLAYLHNLSKTSVFRSFGVYVNTSEGIANDFVRVLNELTGRNDLKILTLINWSNITFKGLLRDERAWCPNCLYEWKLLKEPLYEPLIWNFKLVNICQKHKIKLIDQCQECLKKSAILHRRLRNGYCSNCSSFLGSKDEVDQLI